MRTIYALLFAAVGFLVGAFVGGVAASGAGSLSLRTSGVAIPVAEVLFGGMLGIVIGLILAKHLLHTEMP